MSVALTSTADDNRSLLRLMKEPCLFLDDLIPHRLLVDNLNTLSNLLDKAMRRLPYTDREDRSHGLKELYELCDTLGDVRIMAYDDGRDMTVKVIGTNKASTLVRGNLSVEKRLLDHPVNHQLMGVTRCLFPFQPTYGDGAPARLSRHGTTSTGEIGLDWRRTNWDLLRICVSTGGAHRRLRLL